MEEAQKKQDEDSEEEDAHGERRFKVRRSNTWTEEEDAIIIEGKKNGESITKICEKLPHHKDTAVLARWYGVKKQATPPDVEEAQPRGRKEKEGEEDAHGERRCKVPRVTSEQRGLALGKLFPSTLRSWMEHL